MDVHLCDETKYQCVAASATSMHSAGDSFNARIFERFPIIFDAEDSNPPIVRSWKSLDLNITVQLQE